MKMCALLVQRGLLEALEREFKLDITMAKKDKKGCWRRLITQLFWILEIRC